MKFAALSVAAATVVLGHGASAFQAPMSGLSRSPVRPSAVRPLFQALDTETDKKPAFLKELGSKSEKLGSAGLNENRELDLEQAKLLVQIIRGFEKLDKKKTNLSGKRFSGQFAKPDSNATLQATSVGAVPVGTATFGAVPAGVDVGAVDLGAEAEPEALSQQADEETERGIPPLISLTFRLITKELLSGDVDFEWLRLIGTVVFANIVLRVLDIPQSGAITILNNLICESLGSAIKIKMRYDNYPPHAEYPTVPLKGMMKMVEGVPSIEYWFSLKKFVRVLARALLVGIGLAINPLNADDTSSVENYDKIFKWGPFPNPLVPQPDHIFEKWTEDREFARQYMDGVNPVMLEAVNDPSAQLSAEMLDKFGEDGTVNLQALADANKLFFVNYSGLDELVKMPHQAYPEAYNNPDYTDNQAILDRVGKEPRYFSAPIILFQLTPNEKHMDILGIQLEQTAGADVLTPATCDEDTWLFAKVTVSTVDSQYHEWVSHLGKTHLTMEPHIVAIHNTLKRTNHKIYPFLAPMCRDTLFLNYAARLTLAEFGPDSFGDYMTSVGTGQFMQLILKYWETYDFFGSCAVDDEFKSRGFDANVDMPAYRYRTDATKLWAAYGTFATDYVDECYATDSDVVDDEDLQEWATETSDQNRAAVKGFPETFTTKVQLARTLQTLFWICSGLHAAVNFPQYDYYSYQPNKPLGFRKSPEQQQAMKGDKDWMFEEAMPLLEKAQEGLLVVQVLTLPSKNTIDKLDEYFTEIGTASYETFKDNLAVISAEIEARSEEDRATGNPVYEYLNPKNVPAAIDI